MKNDEQNPSQESPKDSHEELIESPDTQSLSDEKTSSRLDAQEDERASQIAKLRSLFIYALSNATKDLSASFRNDPVFFSSVQMDVLNPEQLRQQFQAQTIQFHLDYIEGVYGEHSIILDLQQSFYFIEMLTGEKIDGMSAAHMDVMVNVFSRLILLMNKNMASKLDQKIASDVCRVESRESTSQILIPDVEWLLCLTYVLNDNRGSGIEVMHVMPFSLMKVWLTLMENVDEKQSADIEVHKGQYSQAIRPVRYQELTQLFSDQTLADYSINLLLDISMQLTVQLGQTRMQIKKILKLGEGSIIGLDKLAGEPVDLLINKQLIAKGEVVVIDENFGVRITEIASPRERLEYLISE